MMVRCGACRNQFDVPGAGRFACPVCGSVNVVREQGEQGSQPAPPGPYPTAPGAVGNSGLVQPAPPPPSKPAPKVECTDCGFSFYVGDIAVATCPNCGAEVMTGLEDDTEVDD
jgi:LSD1 subclass zinc finger protein